MAFDEAGNGQTPVEIDHLRIASHVGLHLLRTADRQDAPVRDSKCLGLRLVLVDRHEGSILKDQICGGGR